MARSDKTTILVVSDMEDDLHAAVIVDELKKRDQHVVCWNPSDIVDSSIRAEFTERHGMEIAGPTGHFSTSGVKSVLYRRPSAIPLSNNVDSDYHEVVRQEWIAAARAVWEMLEFEGATFISHPSNIQRAESKVRQLAVAKDFGLKVPRTIITNCKRDVETLFSCTGNVLAMKKLKSHNIVAGNHTALFVTRVLKSIDQLADFDLAACPIIFQEFVAKTCDVRIIVVGNRTFAFKIFSQDNSETKVDYRAGKETTQQLKHEYYDPPANVVSASCNMVSSFGLKFGALDFAISESGDHFFFELNPNGQWLWLQLATKAPIVDALCNLLINERNE